MKAQYQTFIQHDVQNSATFENILALHGLCERDTVRYLQTAVHDFYPQVYGLTALDLAAGKGVTAMTLAELGFSVAAYDMNRNSICILQRIAMKQELNISFGMGGILQLEKLNKKFDLIHDGDCLTNIPMEADRSRFLKGVKNSLAVDGKFVMTTKIMTSNYNPEDGFESVRMDENHVIWRQTPASDAPGVVELDGKHWTAHKKVAPVESLRAELRAAGFEILQEDLEILPGNNPALLRIVLTSTSGC